MKNNPIFNHLRALSRKEMTRFAAFSDSPYFNKHRDVRALVSYFSEIYPEFTEKNCDRVVLFQRLFPAAKAHDQPQLAIVFSYTLRLLERFLVVEELGKNGEFDDKTHYFKQLRKRSLNSLLRIDWDTETRKQAKQLQALDFATVDFALESLNSARTMAEKDAVSIQLGTPKLHFLQEKQLHLDAFYLVEKLRDACEIVQRSRLMKTVLPADPMLDFLLEKLSTDATILDAQPVVATYLFLYKLLISSGLGDFKKCLETVQENERLLNREAAQGLYNTLQNYCIEQINRGDTVFLREIFKIYQLQLHSKLLLEEGVLPEWHYKNIVTTALRLEERQWARDFIEAYRKHLSPAAADNAYRFNLAAYFYHIGEASKVLPLLVQVEYTDLRYNLDAKALLLRTYFDLSEEEALLAHVEAFTQFVKRNKSLTEFQKKGYFNLIKLTQRAFKLNLQKDFLKPEKWQEQFGKLAADLKSAEPVFNRSWLVLKLEMLKE